MGGEIIFVEATRMAGKGQLVLTGHIGDVMRESAQAAFSLLRSRAQQWGIDPAGLPRCDIHIHVPAAAVPKDGPSAGVAMFAALVSLCADRPVRSHVAMSGEITLRGLVLPVGGIKQKVLAAQRAGIRTVILPQRNKKDLDDVPAEGRKALAFVFAKNVDDVLRAALEPGPRRAGDGKAFRTKARRRTARK
jgi:ATP-dependent Lon protease